MILNLDYQELELSNGVTIEAKSLQSSDYHQLANFTVGLVESSKSGESNDLIGLKQLSNDKLLEVGKAIIPNYCKNLKGISVIEQGSEREATVEDVISYGAFSPFIIAILTKLFEISTIRNEKELKK